MDVNNDNPQEICTARPDEYEYKDGKIVSLMKEALATEEEEQCQIEGEETLVEKHQPSIEFD